MEAILIRAFKQIKADCPRRNKELKTRSEELLTALADKKPSEADVKDADSYFQHLQFACESGQPKILESALDCIHSLIEHGFLRGSKPIPAAAVTTTPAEFVVEGDDAILQGPAHPRILLDTIIETVSRCAEENDDDVHLQVIKVLLTAVTSPYCEVHGPTLLLAVRTCFHIHMNSKNQSNKTSVKAALTQMLSVVNVKMEVQGAALETEGVGAGVSGILGSLSTSSDALDISSNNEGAFNSPVLPPLPPTTSNDESEAAVVISRESPPSLRFLSIMHKDSFLLFRALCIISMKANQDEANSSSSQADVIALPNKLLSLELILHILQRSGPAFRSDESFLYIIRNYLCVSLLRNCTSHVASVIGLSLQIFVALMEGFKNHLKSELEVFVTNVFLRILESENSTYDHKLRVLEVFHTICRDPKALVELFINYDCDLDAIDLFRRIVDGFAKVAKNPSLSQSARTTVEFISSAGKKAMAEEQHLRMMGLEGLVIILRALLRSSGLGTGLLDDSNNDSGVASAAAGGTGGALRSGAGYGSFISPVKPQDAASTDADDGFSLDAVGAVIDTIPANAVDTFDRKQRMQEEIETGILKFNLSSKKGLAYLAAKGHIEMTPESVADFFHQYQEKLDKTILGDYLGREREYENGFCLKVLHEYVDAMDFANKPFDLAIRHFLSGFRLPGEAQKIDRLMEKFAERYYLQNKEVFASADMAFILAFSTIMLQTNLHNPAIKDRRMTKEQFVKQNKGISPDGELPDTLLMEIYDRIAAQPISMTQDDKLIKKMKKDEESSFVVFQTSVDKRRKDAFNDERLEMVRAGEAMFKQKTKTGKAFVRHSSTRSSDDAYTRPMFEVAWAPTIGVLSQILETYEDPSMVDLCLFGFQYAIRLACRLDFPVGRSTYINALATFTALDQVREMRPKNVESIKVMIGIALTEGDFLEESWCQVLLCISQLARLQMFGNGLHTDDLFFKDSSNSSSAVSASGRKHSNLTFSSRSPHEKGSDTFTKLFSGPSRAEAARLVEEANAILVIREISPVAIDRIFINSPKLSGDSVQHFVRSLCEVSLLEISASRITTNIRAKDTSGDSFSPRIFSLQKLVEVADFNMHIRSRIAWTNIWSLLARHFTSVAMYDNHPLAMYAIDSLKQLSIKFLQKEELSNFNFQRVFLKPFEEVISRATSPEIKDLILRCIDIMILACASNIRSGWRSIFAIFEAAAIQEKIEIATLAFDIIERLMVNQFSLLIFDFSELINCLVAFVASDHTTLSLRALKHVAQCADYLGEGDIAAAATTEGAPSHQVAGKALSNSIQVGEDGSVFRLWWPLLFGLSRLVGDSRLDVRRAALDTLNNVLRKFGDLFSPQAWAVIFRGVLFPMIDSAKRDMTRQPVSTQPAENPSPVSNDKANSWIGSMAIDVLTSPTSLYLEFRAKSDAAQLLPEILYLLEDCICQELESLARIGLVVLSSLAQDICPMLQEQTKPQSQEIDVSMDLICDRLCACLASNFCLDFGEAGSVRLSRDVPPEILDKMKACPLTLRRLAMDSDLSEEQDLATLGSVVETPFGPGRVDQIVAPPTGMDLMPRKCIDLGWGYLYTLERYPALEWEGTPDGLSVKNEGNSTISNQTTLAEPDWGSIATAAMTSMVITLDFLRVLQDFFAKGFGCFQAHHHISIMSVLESTHWHARSFNEDQTLRSALRTRSFMRLPENRLPNLLQQEVRSATLLVQVSVKIFVGSGSDAKLFAISEPFVKRYMAIVCNRYMDLDDTLDTSSPVSAELIAAYKPAVLSGLIGLCDLSMQTFRSCISWLGPLLNRLITCHDREVRGALQVIHVRLLLPSLST